MLFRIGLISMVGSTRRRNFQSRRVYPREHTESSPLNSSYGIGLAVAQSAAYRYLVTTTVLGQVQALVGIED